VFPQFTIKPDFVVVTHEPTPAILVVCSCQPLDQDIIVEILPVSPHIA